MEHSSREIANLEMEHRLTEMELLSLSHALNAEVLGLKKCLHYASEVRDEQARDLLREFADRHHRRIDLMLALMDAPGDVDVTHQAKALLQTVSIQGGLHDA